MRPLARLALLAILLLPATAHAAGGIAMRWDRCYGDGGVANKDFACNTNDGSENLVVSFKPPTDLDLVNGNEIEIYLMAPGSDVPAWWQFRTGGSCRSTSLTANAQIPPSSVACLDEFAGNGVTGIGSYTLGVFGANTVRLTVANAVPASQEVTLRSDQEYFALNIRIDHKKTVGTGTCAGCVTPMCLVLGRVNITRDSQPSVLITDPLAPNSHTVGWQGGSPVVLFSEGCNFFFCHPFWSVTACSLPTPARFHTWGMIKSLYR